jgi:hypothetical protein
MPEKLLISNCDNNEYQFIINSDIETPAFISTGETEIIVFTGQTTLCIQYNIIGQNSVTAQTTVIGEYNGKPVYYFQVDTEHEYFFVWSITNSRWEVWTAFDLITGPTCPTLECCENPAESLFYLNDTLSTGSEDPLTTGGMEWFLTQADCDTPYLAGIRISEYCPEIEIITDFVDCWAVVPTPPDISGILTLDIEPTAFFEDCDDCLNKNVTIATNCEDNSIIYLAPGNFSGVVVSLDPPQGEVNCWTVTQGTVPQETEVIEATPTQVFMSCEDCNPDTPEPPEPLPINCDLPTLYRLEDCLGRGKVMHTKEDLSEYIGQIVRSEYYDECFRVFEEEESTEQNFTLNFEIDSVHTNCFDCLPKKPVEPWVNEQCCDEETVQEVVCNYSDGIYKQIVSRRYGIKTIENSDITNNEIRFEALRNKLLCLPYPPLPEPIVREECLTIEQPCVQVQNDCHGCTEPNTIENNPCEACANSEHDCHTYAIRQQEQVFQQASGNDNEWLNGRILFGYFPCGKTESVTVSFTEAFNESYCVLGVPILGYYRNNSFVPLPTTREEQCEAPEENNCCNGNNNQNTDQNQNVEQNNT